MIPGGPPEGHVWQAVGCTVLWLRAASSWELLEFLVEMNSPKKAVQNEREEPKWKPGKEGYLICSLGKF